MKLVYFSWIKDAIGCAEEQVVLPENVHNVLQIIQFLTRQSERHAGAFADLTKLRFAVDLTMATLDTPIDDATEVAIFPPVTGG